MIRNSEFWGGLFWLAVGGYVAWAGRDMGLGDLRDPGSGFAFFWLGLLISAFAIIVMVQAVLAGGESFAALWRGTYWGRVLVVVCLLLVYGIGFEAIGFIPCTLTLLLVLMWFVDPVEWWLAIIVACVATFGMWVAMTKWLKIQLPAGILAGLIG